MTWHSLNECRIDLLILFRLLGLLFMANGTGTRGSWKICGSCVDRGFNVKGWQKMRAPKREKEKHAALKRTSKTIRRGARCQPRTGWVSRTQDARSPSEIIMKSFRILFSDAVIEAESYSNLVVLSRSYSNSHIRICMLERKTNKEKNTS